MRGFSFLLGRVALAASVAGGVVATAACGSILGIDDGSPIGDASDGSTGSDDATTIPDVPSDQFSDRTLRSDANDAGDATSVTDAMDADASDSADGQSEGGSAEGGPGDGQGGDAIPQDGGDAGTSDGGDACASDPNWCTTHCGSGPDLCGVSHACMDYCSAPSVCDPGTNTCVCKRDPMWCSGRCGMINDNCGIMVDCQTCDGGAACNSSNTCGCTPMPNPCGTRQCGQTQDSCQHPVSCGVNGMCANGGVCDVNAGTCCTPNSNPCSGRCSGSVDNGCNQQINCSSPCSSGETCDSQGNCVCPPVNCGNACGTTISNGCATATCTCSGPGLVCDQVTGQCCMPSGGCSPTCVDNCHQSVTCCPEAGPPPDGGPPDGGCSFPGGPCPGGQGCCAGAACNANGMCTASCSTMSCMTVADCCWGFTMCSGIVVIEAGAAPFTGPGMCQ